MRLHLFLLDSSYGERSDGYGSPFTESSKSVEKFSIAKASSLLSDNYGIKLSTDHELEVSFSFRRRPFDNTYRFEF